MSCLRTDLASFSPVSWRVRSSLPWPRYVPPHPSTANSNATECSTNKQTIVATALPTIVQDLGGGKEYSWVGRLVSSLLHRIHATHLEMTALIFLQPLPSDPFTAKFLIS